MNHAFLSCGSLRSAGALALSFSYLSSFTDAWRVAVILPTRAPVNLYLSVNCC